jgi:hypothetical protein
MIHQSINKIILAEDAWSFGVQLLSITHFNIYLFP